MLSALFMALATLAPQETGDFSEIGPWPEYLEVLTYAEPDHFIARNPTAHNQVLLVGDGLYGIRARILLPPNSGIDTRFPVGTMDGLLVEVVTLTDSGWARTGALPYDSLARPGVRAMAVQLLPTCVGSTASLYDGAWSPLARTGDLLSSALPYGSTNPTPPEGSQPLVPPPLHVPAVTPGDIPLGDIAPVIDDTPLPMI